MELIGAGILVAIGFYLAPLVITLVVGAFLVVVGAISSLFSSK
jgi:hypothetical protein